MSWSPQLLMLAIPLAVAPAAAGSLVPTLPIEQLQAGQKALVRTVFEGQRIEEFEAEILGVLKGGRAAGDLIVARGVGDRVQRSGIAQGMSGSPVYVDGKLVGALSTAWSFSREPIFGVTPIREMLEVLDLPPGGPDADHGTAGPGGLDPRGRLGFGEFRWEEEDPAPPRDAPRGPSGRSGTAGPLPLALPTWCAGLHPAALPAARDLLDPLGLNVVPGGRDPGAATSAADLQPGSAVAVELLRGDLDLAAIGTVTYRDGDRVLIFGHPFFQSGPVRLPLATATITTVVSSELVSFKLGSTGKPVGVVTQDRRAALAGRVGASPKLLPVAVRVGGRATAPRRFRFETIEDRTLAPQLVALAGLNSLLESGGAGAGQTVRWAVTLHRAGWAPLRLADVMVSETPATELVGALATPLRFLFQNPYAGLRLDSLSLDLEAEPGRALWTLRRVQVLDAAVRPGRTFRVRCEVERWRGAREMLTLSVRVPEEAPGGRYLMWVGGGAELTRFEASRLPARYRPSSLEEAWGRLATLRPSSHLYAALLARAPEVTRSGIDYPELPTSALALLHSGQRAEDQLRRGSQAILDEVREPLAGQVRGEYLLEVAVDPNAP